MSKERYLLELYDRLRSLPPDERNEIITDYRDHFRSGEEEGLTDTEIIDKLGSPSTIAGQYLSEYRSENRNEYSTDYQNSTTYYNDQPTNAGRNILAGIALLFFNLVFVLGPALGLFGLYIGLFGLSIGMFFGGLGTVRAAFTGMFPFYVNMPFMLPLIHRSPIIASIFGIGLAALGVLFFIGLINLGKVLFRIVVKYFNWNISVINGR